MKIKRAQNSRTITLFPDEKPSFAIEQISDGCLLLDRHI